MLNDYKGETPQNVITKEQHEKRPFYKKVSFWVLSALGLFFGACSVYGLVLGYQYVHAVTEAAHIIADANGSEEESVPVRSLVKNNFHAFNAGVDDIAFVDLGSLSWALANTSRAYCRLSDNIVTTDGTTLGAYVCSSFTQVTYANLNTYPQNYDECFAIRFINNAVYFQVKSTTLLPASVTTGGQIQTALSGLFLYYHMADPSAGTTAHDQFYNEGYDQGYQEGYDDGYQALAGVQNVRILFDENFPTLNPINYSWKVDGQDVASGQIMLRPNQSAPVVNLTRPGGYTHLATLNIWSENDQPLVIAYGRHEGLVIGGAQTYIYDTYNKSNAYDWPNSVWYVPTYNPNTGFLIYSYGTAQQGYTNDYFFEFDPEHNDRAKTGIYADGYDQGYKDGTESGTAYDNGYGAGYDQGYDDGMTIGKAQGEAQAVGGQKALVTMFVTAFQQPFDQIYRFLNFNVLGLNILALFTALLTLSIGIIIIKKVI